MPNEPSSQSAGWALLGGIVSAFAVALAKRLFPTRREKRDEEKDEETRNAAIEKIRSDERAQLVQWYREEITGLKLQITEMAARHRDEIESLLQENRDLRRRIDELERNARTK